MKVDIFVCCFFFFSSRRRHTRFDCDWSSDVCSSDLGSTQWLHPIDRYERVVFGNHPPSISPTRRQLMAAGFPFCSLHATTQHLQPMHFVMSKWKRYCSPADGARVGMHPPSAGVSPWRRRNEGGLLISARFRSARARAPRFVNANVRPSGVARSRSGKGTAPPTVGETLWLDWER